MRILLDTNVLVAAFATRGFCLDIPQLVLAEHRFLVGETVLGELERILAVKLRVPHARVAPWPDTNPDDRWIVAAALVGSADAGRAAGLRIVTPRALWELLQTPRPG